MQACRNAEFVPLKLDHKRKIVFRSHHGFQGRSCSVRFFFLGGGRDWFGEISSLKKKNVFYEILTLLGGLSNSLDFVRHDSKNTWYHSQYGQDLASLQVVKDLIQRTENSTGMGYSHRAQRLKRAPIFWMWRSRFIWAKYNKLIHALLENGAEVREYSCPPPPPEKSFQIAGWIATGRDSVVFPTPGEIWEIFGKRLPNINTSRPCSSATLLGRPKDVTKSFSPLWLLEFIWVWEKENLPTYHTCFFCLWCCWFCDGMTAVFKESSSRNISLDDSMRLVPNSWNDSRSSLSWDVQLRTRPAPHFRAGVHVSYLDVIGLGVICDSFSG